MAPYSPVSRNDDTSFITSAQRGSTREPAERRARLSRREPNWRLSFSSSIREYSPTMSLNCSFVFLLNLYLVGYFDRRESTSHRGSLRPPRLTGIWSRPTTSGSPSTPS